MGTSCLLQSTWRRVQSQLHSDPYITPATRLPLHHITFYLFILAIHKPPPSLLPLQKNGGIDLWCHWKVCEWFSRSREVSASRHYAAWRVVARVCRHSQLRAHHAFRRRRSRGRRLLTSLLSRFQGGNSIGEVNGRILPTVSWSFLAGVDAHSVLSQWILIFNRQMESWDGQGSEAVLGVLWSNALRVHSADRGLFKR